MPENLHVGHRSRLKRRFLKTGLDVFEQHEALELLLFYAIPKKDINPLAHRLIKMFGSIAGVFNAPYEMLLSVDGLGEHSAILLKQIPQLFRLYCDDLDKTGEIMDSPEKWIKLFKAKFIGRVVEVLFVAGMDDFARLISVELISSGSRRSLNIPCDVLIKFTMRWNVDRIVLAHNHPNGIAAPSTLDKLNTQKLNEILKSLNITLVDHFVFGKNLDAISMRKYGILY